MKDLQFQEEKNLVRDLRYNKKLKYYEIAKRLNRSLYWVHCRLSDNYSPAGSRVEKKFQDEIVKNFLEKNDHKIIYGNTRNKCSEFGQEVDIKSKKDGLTYITEIKNVVNHHQLQTAIGQMTLHQYVLKNNDNIVYQIVFPKKFQNWRYFSQDFLNYIKERFSIYIIFV